MGAPVVGLGDVVTGTTAGTLLLAADAFVSTPMVPSGTQRMSVNVCAHFSPAPHFPLHGSASHKPVLGLQNVSPVQMAMHPPAPLDAAAAPIARPVVVAAPAIVFELPVWHAATETIHRARPTLVMLPPI